MQNGSDMRDLVGDDAEEAQVWMRDFKKHMLMATLTLTAARLPEAHARAFPVHVAQGSEAETWWNGLNHAQRGSWATIQTEFDTKWPPVRARDVPITEHIDAFHVHIFPVEQIDARVPTGVGSATRWAHTVFADKLKSLGTKTTLPEAALIQDAMRQIPQAMAELMQPHARLPWARWCEALGELDTADIRTRQAVYDRLAVLEERQAQHDARIANTRAQTPQTPRSGYATPNQYHGAATYQAPRTPAQTPRTWGRTAGDAAQQDPPPKSPASTARVEQDRRDWTTQYPDGRPYASRPYPLSPGTVSAEKGCTRCGLPETPSHTRYSCTSSTPLPELEQKYRANVKLVLNRAGPTPPYTPNGPTPMTPGALGTPGRARGWSSPRGQFGRGAYGRGGWGSPATPSPVHAIEYDESVDEEVEDELNEEHDAGNDEGTA